MAANSVAQRDLQTATCSVVCVPHDLQLEPLALLDTYLEAFRSVGETIGRVTIERQNSRQKTYALDKAQQLLRADAAFSSLWTIPTSDTGADRETWTTAGIFFNHTRFKKTAFFGFPSGEGSYIAHIKWWRSLATLFDPPYGFGFQRRYGLGPEYLAVGVPHNALGNPEADFGLIETWGAERSGDPAIHTEIHRHEKGKLLDLFPLNLLSGSHLEARVGPRKLRDLIVRATGEDSLLPISRNAVAWLVPDSDIERLRNELRDHGLLIPRVGTTQRKH